ncbi:uncharacterized protein LOC111828761 [Capsella rubella]|uniref:uncharacterized protein LOC111828761 n=1 Tax=Capsella rubella TaxID=81985 RepID=UPI000CD518F6|nr:uncharacterized protein LOC111828761 [Capsella rubella]
MENSIMLWCLIVIAIIIVAFVSSFVGRLFRFLKPREETGAGILEKKDPAKEEDGKSKANEKKVPVKEDDKSKANEKERGDNLV